jgi:hypothetical protein
MTSHMALNRRDPNVAFEKSVEPATGDRTNKTENDKGESFYQKGSDGRLMKTDKIKSTRKGYWICRIRDGLKYDAKNDWL